MTEFEINKKVAQKLGIEFDITHLCGERLVRVDNFKTTFDPCNNPSQAMEIILTHDISVSVHSYSDMSYVALKGLASRYGTFDPENLYCDDKFIINEKPFVAAMLLFLEV